MSKYHVTPDGPRLCTASKRACPVGGEHFSQLASAESAYELTFGDSLQGVKKTNDPKAVGLPRASVTALVKPFAGGRYYGCHVSETSINAHLDAWKEEVGYDKASLMERNKADRDRGRVYHLTVVTPPEMKNAKDLTPFPSSAEIIYEGVGKAVDGDNEAWFVVCTSPEIAAWREANNLPPKDLHVTLGFDAKDVHTKPKGKDSLALV